MALQHSLLTEFESLDCRMQSCWEHLLDNSPMIQAVMAGCSDRRLYALYLIETYQYTRHNAQNQAVVAIRLTSGETPYLQFCLRHASDEAGHEQMAIHNLTMLGVDPVNVTNLTPLPATEVLVAYLYWISVQGNPVQRLGYSYWAENSYHFIGPILETIQENMKLERSQMTFFIEHASIDTRHSEWVRRMIQKMAITRQDWQDIARVLETSLRLTGNILMEVCQQYENLKAGEPSPYAFLNRLSIE